MLALLISHTLSHVKVINKNNTTVESDSEILLAVSPDIPGEYVQQQLQTKPRSKAINVTTTQIRLENWRWTKSIRRIKGHNAVRSFTTITTQAGLVDEYSGKLGLQRR